MAIRHRPEIDGLRAIAVTPVILFHAGYYRFSGGFIGVDVFFVISGFLITGIIWEELQRGDFSIARFYARRARRILPALLLVLFVSSIFALLWMMPKEMTSFGHSVLAALAFGSNFYFWQSIDYFAPAAMELPLLHLWSLGVEEQFYLLFPLLLVLVVRWRRRAVLGMLGTILIVSLLLSEVGQRVDPLANFYLLPSRAWELLFGACASLIAPKIQALQSGPWRRLSGPVAWLGLVMILASFFIFNESTPTPSLYLLPAVAGSALVLLFATKDNLCGRLLSLGRLELSV